MKNNKIEIYAKGLVHCSVCAEKYLSYDAIEKYVNEVNPTGITSAWKISQESFGDGTKNPSFCPDDPKRKHYLLVC